jgi:hypothetical protein
MSHSLLYWFWDLRFEPGIDLALMPGEQLYSAVLWNHEMRTHQRCRHTYIHTYIGPERWDNRRWHSTWTVFRLRRIPTLACYLTFDPLLGSLWWRWVWGASGVDGRETEVLSSILGCTPSRHCSLTAGSQKLGTIYLFIRAYQCRDSLLSAVARLATITMFK